MSSVHPTTRIRLRRSGVVLLVVLVVVSVMMLIGYSFFQLMQAEQEAVEAANRVSRGRIIADSGLHYTAFLLAYPQAKGLSDAADSLLIAPSTVYDNPEVFQAIPSQSANPRHQGYFSVIARRDVEDMSASQGFRFGVEDEGAKINLNALLKIDSSGKKARDILLKLPSMTDETANAILNWIRPPGNTSDSAAGDSAYYATLGYTLKSGPLESLDELLLVRGITQRMLFGNDANRNGILDPEEDDANGTLDPGLAGYVTIYSRERNIDSQGQPRIYVNDNTDLQALYEKLIPAVGDDVATFLIAYRLYGPSSSSSSSSGKGGSSGGSNARGNLDFSRGRNGKATKINSLMDLVQATVMIPSSGSGGKGQNSGTLMTSPFVLPNNTKTIDIQAVRQKLPLLLDKATTSSSKELPARVNINTAPRDVLMTLPGLADADVQAIMDLRPTNTMDPMESVLYRTPAWLLSEAGFKPSLVQQIEPYITTRSEVYRAQVVAYYEQGGPITRLEAVIDTNAGRPRFLYWRDVSSLGGKFDMNTLLPTQN